MLVLILNNDSCIILERQITMCVCVAVILKKMLIDTVLVDIVFITNKYTKRYDLT